VNSHRERGRGRHWSNPQIAAAIFLLAFTIRIGLMLALHPYTQTLRVEIQHLAYSIASGNGYSNPYPTPTGPTALYSPGCPLILAAIYRVFGYGSKGEAVSCLLNIAASSLVFSLLPLLATRLRLTRRIGVLAGLAGALIPVYLLNEFHSTTATMGALCLMALTLMTARVWTDHERLTVRLAVSFGVAWGVALLISPNLLLIGLLWLIAAIVNYRTKALAFSAVTLVLSLAILMPWGIRNQLVLGAPIFSRSNLGLELWIANNDVAAASYGDNDKSHSLYQPFMNSQEAESLAREGEVNYMHQRMAMATAWIKNHPRRFAELTTSRIFHFWFPIAFRPVQTFLIGALSVAGLAGLAFTFARNRAAFYIVGSIWLAFPAIYYLVQLDNPYRYPIYWSILLFAAYGCLCTVDALRGLQPAATRRASYQQPVGMNK
jgi:hypothetical protein